MEVRQKLKILVVLGLCMSLCFFTLSNAKVVKASDNEGNILEAEMGMEEIEEESTEINAASDIFTVARINEVILDEAFAEAVYNSINEQPGSFLDGKTIEDYTSIEELLNEFTGDINARQKGITKIDGVSALKVCNRIDLSQNQIKDISPLSVTNAVNADDVSNEENTYYGTRSKAVTVSLSGNPVYVYPAQMGGRITVEPSLANHTFLLQEDSKELRFLVQDSGPFTSTIQIPGLFRGSTGANIGEVILEDGVIPYYEIGDNAYNDRFAYEEYGVNPTGAILTDQQLSGVISQVNLASIKETGDFDIELKVSDTDQLRGMGARSKWSQALSWAIPVNVKIYTQVRVPEAEVKTEHHIKLTKFDEDGNETLEGAVYNLYRIDESGEVLIAEGLATDENGNLEISSLDNAELSQGDYYFKEVISPDGYAVNDDKIPFSLQNGSITVIDGEGKTISVTSDGVTKNEETLDDGVFVLGGGEKAAGICITPPDGSDGKPGKLKSITVKWTAGTLEDGTAGETTYEVGRDGTIDDVEKAVVEKLKEAQSMYQTVQLSGQFVQTVSQKQMDRRAADFSFTKVSEDGETVIPGAGFTIYQCNSQEEGHTHGAGCWETREAVVGQTEAISDEDGRVSFEKLPVDSYYILAETQKPEGYKEITEGSFIGISVAHDRTVTCKGYGDFEKEGMLITDNEGRYKIKNIHQYDLTIHKVVKGDGGDLTRKFDFTITLKDADGHPISGEFECESVNGAEIPNGGTLIFDSQGQSEIRLKHNQSIIIKGIEAYSQFEVKETEIAGYTVSAENQSSDKMVSDITAEFINEKYANPLMGIWNNGKAGIIVLVTVLIGIMALTGHLLYIRKRVR